MFQYDFAYHTGGGITSGKDIMQVHIYVDNGDSLDRKDYDMWIEEEGKKVVKFSYVSYKDNCYEGITTHYVEM